MTRPAPFTKANLRRAIAAAQAAGLTVTGIAPDGTVLIGDNHAAIVPDPDTGGQDDPYVTAVWRAVRRAETKRKRNRAAS